MRIWFLFILLFGFSVTSCNAETSDYTAQQELFLHAKKALAHHDRIQFLILSRQLKDYPLYSYLIYDDIKQRLNTVNAAEIVRFLQDNANTPIAARLNSDWLTHLANQQNWPEFFEYYRPSDDTNLQCLYLQGLVATQQEAQAIKLLPTLWLVGETQPLACENTFKVLHKTGNLSSPLIWQRVELALQKNNQELAKGLIPWLSAEQQAQAKLWLKIKQNPALVNNTALFLPLNSINQTIVNDGISLWAKRNSQKVAAAWPSLAKTFHFDQNVQQNLMRSIALGLAADNDPNAKSWLAKIKPENADQKVREWRVRTALAQKNWSQVLSYIKQLQPTEQNSDIWNYWRARALAATGNQREAQQIYQSLAKKVDYYAVLANWQLKTNYQPQNHIQSVAPQITQQVRTNPGIERAYELYRLKYFPDARREWVWATAAMNQQQLCAAAQLADQWGWYDRAIATAAKGNDWNNIDLRFPVGYEQQVRTAAAQIRLNPAWALGIMRQESNFMVDAKSGVGAMGLMQLMPSTAKTLANFKMNQSTLLDSNTNIYLGTRYLKHLSEWAEGNFVIATAAYNVGPARLQKYIANYNKLPLDIWIENIPWQETRNYVKAVLLGTVIYEQKL